MNKATKWIIYLPGQREPILTESAAEAIRLEGRFPTRTEKMFHETETHQVVTIRMPGVNYIFKEDNQSYVRSILNRDNLG